MITIDFGIGISVGTIIGFSIREIIKDRLSRDRAREDRDIRAFNEAATKFREAFRDEILALDARFSSVTIDTSTLLEAAFEKHRSAVFDFKHFLAGENAVSFEKAWNEYYSHETEHGKIEALVQYAGLGHPDSHANALRQLAKARLEKLLMFAQHR